MIYRLACLLLFTTAVTAQSLSSAQLQDQMQHLPVHGSVLYIAAHPDDENTGLLTCFVHQYHLRTAYLSLTRGDGGQNLIGKEKGELIGVIRTQELLAARNIDGAEQFFTRAYDFGYSKHADETLKLWDSDSILGDMVWVIRSFRPDLIITRFPEGIEAGHGQHSASAILAREAFTAAADPLRFPEQLSLVKPWKAKRIYWNVFQPDSIKPTAGMIALDAGQYNPLLGKSYGEIAAESRSKHRCQGMGTPPSFTTTTEYFKYVAGDSAHQNLFDGIDLTWNAVDASGKLNALLILINRQFNPLHPESSLDNLAKAYILASTPGLTGINYLREELARLMSYCAGVVIRAASDRAVYTKGAEVNAKLEYHARSSTKMSVHSIVIPGGNTIPFSQSIHYTIPLSAAYSTPYLLRQNRIKNLYQDNGYSERGKPVLSETWNTITAILDYKGIQFPVNVPLNYYEVLPARGEVSRNAELIPAVIIHFNDPLLLQKDSLLISLTVSTYENQLHGTLHIDLPAGWKALPGFKTLTVNKDSPATLSFMVMPGNENNNETNLVHARFIDDKDVAYIDDLSFIRYEHIPEQVIIKPAVCKIIKPVLSPVAGVVGYLDGAGDEMPEGIQRMGYTVKKISIDSVSTLNPSVIPVVITGIRFFNIQPGSKLLLKQLLEYVNAGGRLIVQYNTDNHLLAEQPGPYPLNISRLRVTEEDAAVTSINKNAELLNHPNPINASDWNNWVQERGLYFPGDADMHYEKIISMHDTGEAPLENGIVTTAYGKGRFTYCALSLFRQIPAGVPGAYKLLQNLIELK